MNNKTENWIHLDAEGKTLGRLSTDIARYLQGKDKVDYSPHTLSSNFVVITNVDKITVTGNKLKGKELYSHSGYMGGLKKELLGAFTIIVVAAIVSKYWKISLHMLGIGGLVGVLLSLELLFGGLHKLLVLFIFLSGILGVARIKEKAHNHSQVFFGFVIGFLIEISFILLL